MSSGIGSTAATLQIGSAAWINASNYAEGSRLHMRATNFLEATNWEELCNVASTLRDGVDCQVSETYSLGYFNFVRALTFSDDITWIARLRLPELGGEEENLDEAASIRWMDSEVATARLLKLRTSIPVPEVFHYDTSSNNNVGAPYMIMSYFPGNTALEQSRSLKCPEDQFGTPAQDLNFRKQMACLQVELSSLKFDKIGSIYQDGDDFVIGPEPQAGLGPWSNALEYYQDITQCVVDTAEVEAGPEVKNDESFTAVPMLGELLMQCLGPQLPKETQFGLANRDFGAHNLLVDTEFNIIGLIDFDGVLAAPFSVIAQFPQLTGLDRGFPGYVETSPNMVDRVNRMEPLLKQYRDIVALAEAEMSVESKDGTGISENLFEDISYIVELTQQFAMHSAFVNRRLQVSLETFLKKFSA